MAYPRRTNYRRRRPTRRRYSTRRRNGYAARAYRPRFRRRRITTRRIRDIASRKCRDNMMPVRIQTDGGGPTQPGLPFTIDGTLGAQFLFVPSARIPGPQFGNSERSKTRTYCRGYKERVSLVTNSQAHWLWRRIVFRCRMLNQFNNFPTGIDPYTTVTARTTEHGQVRTLWNVGDQTNADYEDIRDNLQELVFEGASGQDWASPFTAKTDPAFIKVISDRTINLGGAQADTGRIHNKRFWYPVNKTLVYNDEEEGRTPAKGDSFSSLSDETCGDIVVYDLFTCQGEAGDQLQFGPEGTYYWHEG